MNVAKGRQANAEADVGKEGKADRDDGSSTGTEGSSGGGDRPGQPLIDLDFVRGLIEAVDGSGIDSLEITRAGTRVKIAKTPPAAGPAPSMYAGPPAMAPQPAPPAPTTPAPPSGGQSAPAAGTAAAPAEPEAEVAAGGGAPGLVDVESPMVGTFYRAPAPEAPAYVEVGTRVSKGQTLCILEAMKLMNELEAEVDGVVREILVDNAEPVEYGQVLFRIDPNG